MPNFFKKLGQNTNNFFKKVDSGANNFLKKLPSTVDTVTNAVGTVARKTANTLEKVAPIIAGAASVVAPEMSPAIMNGLNSAQGLARRIQQGSNQMHDALPSMSSKIASYTNKTFPGANQQSSIMPQTLMSKASIH